MWCSHHYPRFPATEGKSPPTSAESEQRRRDHAGRLGAQAQSVRATVAGVRAHSPASHPPSGPMATRVHAVPVAVTVEVARPRRSPGRHARAPARRRRRRRSDGTGRSPRAAIASPSRDDLVAHLALELDDDALAHQRHDPAHAEFGRLGDDPFAAVALERREVQRRRGRRADRRARASRDAGAWSPTSQSDHEPSPSVTTISSPLRARSTVRR